MFKQCGIVRNIAIEKGCLDDYQRLCRFHYRSGRLGPFEKIFTMRFGRETVGVIVYTLPSPNLAMRHTATGGEFAGFERRTQLALINENIRCIGRVIIEPRLRCLGLAVRLVRETMPLMRVSIIETLAVMGLVNPFFEKAGMQAFAAPLSRACEQMKEAFGFVEIEDDALIDAQKVYRKIKKLSGKNRRFIENQIRLFLGGYGKRRYEKPGIEQLEFVLGRLTNRPVYYIWFNPDIQEVGKCRTSSR